MSLKQLFAIEVVRQIEQSIEVVIEASDQDTANEAVLAHLEVHGSQYKWSAPETDTIVWRNRIVNEVGEGDILITSPSPSQSNS